jgi:hypothetical protein
MVEVRKIMQDTAAINERLLYQGPSLSVALEEFLTAKRTQLPEGSREPAYFEHRIRAFLEIVGDKCIANYTEGDLTHFAGKLQFLPERHTVDPAWRGKTLTAALEENRSRPPKHRAKSLYHNQDWLHRQGQNLHSMAVCQPSRSIPLRIRSHLDSEGCPHTDSSIRSRHVATQYPLSGLRGGRRHQAPRRCLASEQLLSRGCRQIGAAPGRESGGENGAPACRCDLIGRRAGLDKIGSATARVRNV